jgi:hypothetical protein
MIFGFKLYSQLDTNQIYIPTRVAREILLDLNLLDKLKKEQILTEKQIKELENKCKTQDSIIVSLEQKDLNNNILIETHKEKVNLLNEDNKQLREDIKKTKLKTTIVEVFTGVVLTTLTYLQFFK